MKDEKQNGEIAVIESQSVKLAGDPQDRLKQGKEAAKALMTVAKPVMIQGKPYLTIKDWQTIGSFYGLFSGAEDAEPVIDNELAGYRARAVVRKADGTIVCSAIAYCYDEGIWKGREKFAQASMAQTRAASKALRNCVGWVAHLAGYEDTPAEEMDFQDKGITQDHSKAVTQKKTKVVEDDDSIMDIADTDKAPYITDLKCPECGETAVDRRAWDDDGNFERVTYQSGKRKPAFECIDNDDFNNPTCKGVIWDVPPDATTSNANASTYKETAEEELPF